MDQHDGTRLDSKAAKVTENLIVCHTLLPLPICAMLLQCDTPITRFLRVMPFVEYSTSTLQAGQARFEVRVGVAVKHNSPNLFMIGLGVQS